MTAAIDLACRCAGPLLILEPRTVRARGWLRRRAADFRASNGVYSASATHAESLNELLRRLRRSRLELRFDRVM